MNSKNTNRIFPLIKKSRYYNGPHDRFESFFFDTLPSFITAAIGRKKRLPENIDQWIRNDPVIPASNEPVITWIGHATFLIQVAGINILTDPIFGDASFLFKRVLPPGIALAQLPPIDIVLLSHNHPDHCHAATLKAVRKAHPKAVFLVPQGDARWLKACGLAPVHEHTWWQQYVCQKAENAPVTCTFLPSYHWSARGMFDRNRSLWGSWMIEHGRTHIYFAGDTAYSPHFKSIAQEFSSITSALLPIAPREPHPYMRRTHLDAHEAVQAFLDLQATQFIPMHWGAFLFGKDHFDAPIQQLHAAWQKQNIDTSKQLAIVKVGQRVQL
jgi:L-ascorbate metabolism protein UlaG (beta-lactamase superfamily)